MILPSENSLSSFPNSYRNKTYIVSVIQEITLNGQAFQFGLRYAPDKLLLDHEGLAGYLEQMLNRESKKAELLAHDILEDIMNQIIPKWIEINLKHEENKFGQSVLITIEDRQPGWESASLLNRLPALF